MALGHFYELAGFSEGDGIMTGAVYRVISIVIAAVGAVCYFTIRRDVSTAIHQGEQESAEAARRPARPSREARSRRLRDRRNGGKGGPRKA